MKKIIVALGITMITTFMATSCFANEELRYTEKPIKFRDYEWGTNVSEIIEKECDGLVEGVDYEYTDNKKLLIINKEVAGFSANITFIFTDQDELCEGSYVFTEKHVNNNLYYSDYNDLCKKITSVYGDPIGSKEDWNDDLFKDDPSDIGTALAVGHVVLSTAWYAEDKSYLIIYCGGDNYTIDMAATYYAPGDLGLIPANSKNNTDGL